MGRRKPKPTDTPAAETQPGVSPLPGSLVRRQVVFARDHRHAGVEYRKGEKLYVTDREADRLREFGAIEAG